MRVVVLVPRRADGGRRDQLWEWVRDRWATETPWDVIEGHHDGPEKFNRSAAINQAAGYAERHGGWDVAVITDSDTICGTDQVQTAVDGALGPCRFWLAYDRYMYLSRQMTDRIMRGYAGAWEPGVEWSMTGTCSSMVVVHRSLWDRVGGFDSGFEGWGFEDVAFSHACQTFGNGLQRVPGPVWHLHHPPSTENNHHSPEWQANRARVERYAEVSYDPDGMDALLKEYGVL